MMPATTVITISISVAMIGDIAFLLDLPLIWEVPVTSYL
jgi:hypothetical protein